MAIFKLMMNNIEFIIDDNLGWRTNDKVFLINLHINNMF